MTVGGWCRALRAGVFAAACVLLAALGHVLMSGAPVPWWTMVVGTVATGAAGWLLAGRERGCAPIVAFVVAAQAVLHEGFSLGQTAMSGATPGPGTPPVAPAGTDMASMDMGRMDMGPMDMSRMGMGSLTRLTQDSGGLSHPHGVPGMGDTASVGMLAVHLCAAVLCGLWLAYGERAVFRVLRAAAARLAAPLRMLLALPVPVRRPSVRGRRVDGRRWWPVRFLVCCSVTSRGPPVGAAVA